jgi:hypothetical protein
MDISFFSCTEQLGMDNYVWGSGDFIFCFRWLSIWTKKKKKNFEGVRLLISSLNAIFCLLPLECFLDALTVRAWDVYRPVMGFSSVMVGLVENFN